MGYLKKLFILTVFAITTITNINTLDDLLVDISITTKFDTDTLTSTVNDVAFGTNISLDSSLGSLAGYNFAYWIVNDTLEESLNQSYSFTVNQEMNIVGVFANEGQSLAVFRDTNGKVLDIQFITNGQTPIDPSITLPSKPGYLVATTNKWGETLSSISENKIYTLNYQIDTASTFDLTVTNGSNGGTYTYNSMVTVTADSAPSGQSFSHWEEEGQVISRSTTDTFGVLASRSIEAVYTDGIVSDAPFINLTGDLAVRTSEYSYISRFHVPNDFTLIEWGMIANDTSEFDMDTVGISLHQGFFKMADTNAFMMSFDKTTCNFVRAYIVLKDYEGDLVTMYSDTLGPETLSESSEFYTTGWEDASKGAYAIGDVTSNSQTWSFNNSLVGTLVGDLKEDLKSIRMKTGDVTSYFTVSDLSEINFLYGKYGTDDPSSLYLEISADKSNWTTLETLTTGSSLIRYTHTLDSDEYTSLGLDSSAAYYIRFRTDNDERVNIDDLHIMAGSDVATDFSLESMKQSKAVTISLPENLASYYTIGEEFTADMCTATDIVDGAVTCTVEGVVDNETEGLYTMTYSATSYEGIVFTTSRQITILNESYLQYLNIDYTGYYDGIEGLYGNDLLLALRTIINTGIERVSYGDASIDLGIVDEDPNNSSNVLLFYYEATLAEGDPTSVSSVWDSGVTWNREHVWPNSRLGISRVSNSSISIGSDLHNLRACDPTVNSTRNNYVFSESGASETWFPGDRDKGDAARILFYMYVMYSELQLLDSGYENTTEENYTLTGARMGILHEMLVWDDEDPVSAFETSRNEAIFGIQKNRNPFIDYPYLADLIWYDYEAPAA
jgi:hypothetical protein